MHRNLKVLLVILASGVLTACPPTYPKCNSDENCKDHGEVCVQGQCQECATDQNCKPGFVCDANKCVPKPECMQDNDCKGGGKCKSGRCEKETKKEGCSSNAECPSGQDCVAGSCAPKAEKCDYSPIRFEFNESKLTAEGQSRLSALADCIKAQKLRFSLGGHADERGTEEYNLQLSNRRAESVKKYLVTLGVEARELDTVGFGENRPAVQGSNEAAWAANRRVELDKK